MKTSSYVIDGCQLCKNADLKSVLFIGYLPPVNDMPRIGSRPTEQPAYPAELMLCPQCQLVQLSCVVDAKVLFPPEYPYTSRSTKILRENFAELSEEARRLVPLDASSLVIDVGSNDGTLLSNFQRAGFRVRGIEPTERAKEANASGIPTDMAFFDADSAQRAVREVGKARIVTATNVFAHIDHVHDVVQNIVSMLDERGVFISESHYLHALLDTLQYDTIYHEHLRYYSVQSLRYLLERAGLEIFHVKRIPTHGGSVRVYAARRGSYPVTPAVAEILTAEQSLPLLEQFKRFRQRISEAKLELYRVLADLRKQNKRVVGIGAPSRASTLLNYLGLDDALIDAVLEIKGSHKVGKYMPGTMIPVLDESYLLEQQPEVAMLLSWHIADELIPKLRERGFRGQFLVPLPEPRLV
ncbi:MAG TPA: class I SAM-dependent methyltransferase [Polyangiales bacterium]|nr:class I SAM-dependent methyltransferase [Polyangiales bacterium]